MQVVEAADGGEDGELVVAWLRDGFVVAAELRGLAASILLCFLAPARFVHFGFEELTFPGCHAAFFRARFNAAASSLHLYLGGLHT